MNVEQEGLMAIIRVVCAAMGNLVQQNTQFANSIMEMEKKIKDLEMKVIFNKGINDE